MGLEGCFQMDEVKGAGGRGSGNEELNLFPISTIWKLVSLATTKT